MSNHTPNDAEPHYGSFISKHWHGGYSLPVSYWLIGFVVNLVLSVVIVAMGSWSENLSARIVGAVLIFMHLSVLILSVWQTVGIWRSANKHESRGGAAGWARAAKVMVVVGVIAFALQFATNNLLQIKEGVHLVVHGDSIPESDVRVSRDGRELVLSGGMNKGTTNRVIEVLEQNPGIEILHLNSVGGWLAEATMLSRVIKQHDLTTYTSGRCMSACAYAFLSAQRRYLSEQGALGFHGVSLGSVEANDYNLMNQDAERLMSERGVPRSFISRALSVPSDDMWFPEHDVLLDANVVDRIVDPDNFFSAPALPNTSVEEYRQSLQANPLYAVIYQHYPRLSQQIDLEIERQLAEGLSLEDIRAGMRSVMMGPVMFENLVKAPDDLLVDYFKTQFAEVDYLNNHNADACVAYLLADTLPEVRPVIAHEVMPGSLIDNDVQAFARALEGAALNGVAERAMTDDQLYAGVDQMFDQTNEEAFYVFDHVMTLVQDSNNNARICDAYRRLFYDITHYQNTHFAAEYIRMLLGPV
ncbi:MAG: hypothetical protein AseanaTS_15730 [Candidatus Pelagadaptatus aseana]|uniref:COG3904 family protein n=1 Tax=Candidatus Pelagadaptatus aseana TaxID=3120508 RepID=UPI0039B15C20